jgi:chemotaxis protein CheD
VNIFLRPGEIFVSKNPVMVTTILGSCVSVTMFANRLRMGGICHARLPHGRGANPLDYVDTAIVCTARILDRMGVKRDETKVKLFGGAEVLNQVCGSGKSVGRRNIETALEMIEGLGLHLSGRAVGGSLGRKLCFQTSTGWVSWTYAGSDFESERNTTAPEADVILAKPSSVISGTSLPKSCACPDGHRAGPSGGGTSSIGKRGIT